MIRRDVMYISGYFRQYDTFADPVGRRYLDLYILSVDGSQILKTVRLLDHDDGTQWNYVYKEITDIGSDDNWGMVRYAVGRADQWFADKELTVEWVPFTVSSYTTWWPETTPDGRHINFGPSQAPEAHMGTTFHIDTSGSSDYKYYFYGISDYTPYLGPLYDIHISGWFRQYDTIKESKLLGRRYVDFYIVDTSTLEIIASQRILDYYDGTDWVYRRIYFQCPWYFSGTYFLAIGRRDAWSADLDVTAEWCNVQIWTYG